MTTLIERGAIALLREDAPEERWSALPDYTRLVYLRRSRACLEAFLEPTAEMHSAGADAWNEEKPPDYIYRAMIAAELETDT